MEMLSNPILQEGVRELVSLVTLGKQNAMAVNRVQHVKRKRQTAYIEARMARILRAMRPPTGGFLTQPGGVRPWLLFWRALLPLPTQYHSLLLSMISHVI
jgi:hypothetical protein